MEKEAIIIFNGKTARKLLRLGFTIIDVKPDKYKNDGSSLFVFRRETINDKSIEECIED